MEYYNPTKHILITQNLEPEKIIEDIFSGNNPKALKEFCKYLIQESSGNELLFYLGIIDYSKRPTWEKLNYLLHNFVSHPSPYEVNLPSAAAAMVKVVVHQENRLLRRNQSIARTHRADYPARMPRSDFFEATGVEIAAILNLADNWSRYSLGNVKLIPILKMPYVPQTTQQIPAEFKQIVHQMMLVGFNDFSVLLK